VIKIKKHYCHYNHENDEYYLDKSYPYKNSKKYDNNKEKHKDHCKVNINVNCNCDHKKDKKKENTRPSAFRASKATNQPVAANATVKVLYQNERFDLANEYNPATSTFIPATDGVYNLIATVHFRPNMLNVSYQIFVTFTINGVITGADIEFKGGSAVFLNENIVETADILNLNAGDVVEVLAITTVPGQYLAGGGTRFSASRVPSPAN